MSKITAITNTLKKFSGKPLAITSKALGVASVAAVIYDSHVNGKIKADSTDVNATGDRYFKQYKQFMSTDKNSASVNKLKRVWYDMQQNFSYYHPFYKTKGYLSGFGKTLLNELPIIGLSAIALKCKKIGKAAGVLLGINAVKVLLFDVLGIAKEKNKKI